MRQKDCKHLKKCPVFIFTKLKKKKQFGIPQRWKGIMVPFKMGNESPRQIKTLQVKNYCNTISTL